MKEQPSDFPPLPSEAVPLYAGIMTGTSLDAATAVLADFKDGGCRLLASAEIPIARKLADEWRALAHDDSGLARAMEAANAVAILCAEAIAALPAAAITAVGCHGQTVLHRPARGWTLQLLNGALLAELTGVDVVCDFRSRDMAAGGQGAPLTPLFHRYLFAGELPCAVVNLGGIANLTVVDENSTRGWDVGPANMLMDAWHSRHMGGAFDRNGEWAAGGVVDSSLLKSLLAHPFLALPPPKSCGREEFDLGHFEHLLSSCRPQDAQATLLEWSAQNIAAAVRDCSAGAAPAAIFLCGGGARNTALVERLRALLPSQRIRLSDDVGVSAECVEAAAFAWLAMRFMEGKSSNTPPVTGAKGARILGAHYPR